MAENELAVHPVFEGDRDKLLFADDVTAFIVRRITGFDEPLHRASEFRELAYNAFDENMKQAIDFLLHQKCARSSYRVPSGFRITSKSFLLLLNFLGKRYFSEGFDAKKFLYSCVHLGTFAAYCRICNYTRAPKFASRSVLVFLNKYDMTTGGWDVLKNVAAEYAGMYHEFKTKCSLTDMTDGYTLVHLRNPDFYEGTREWKRCVSRVVLSPPL